MFRLTGTLTIEKIMADTAIMLDGLDCEALADGGRIGALGYCMSSQFAIAAAAKWPDRIKAAPSIYSVAIITDAPDSPHKPLGSVRDEVYIAIA
jgi:carboxymethylenebutenolidase